MAEQTYDLLRRKIGQSAMQNSIYRFQTAHSRFGIFKFDDLAVELMRQMMTGDRIDHSFHHRLFELLRGGGITQRRIDLQVSIVIQQIGIGEKKMMRRKGAAYI